MGRKYSCISDCSDWAERDREISESSLQQPAKLRTCMPTNGNCGTLPRQKKTPGGRRLQIFFSHAMLHITGILLAWTTTKPSATHFPRSLFIHKHLNVYLRAQYTLKCTDTQMVWGMALQNLINEVPDFKVQLQIKINTIQGIQQLFSDILRNMVIIFLH